MSEQPQAHPAQGPLTGILGQFTVTAEAEVTKAADIAAEAGEEESDG
jgi:hypothetical protein